MTDSDPSFGWNELDFVPWTQFKQMGPSIIGLEIRRLGSLIDSLPPEPEMRNALVKARHELGQFVATLEESEKDTPSETYGTHLRAAVLALSAVDLPEKSEALGIVNYVRGRLNYVYNRLPLIY